MKHNIAILITTVLLLIGCTQEAPSETETVVTRLSEVPVTVEVTRLVEEEIEVTRLVEITRQVEVTRLVEVTPPPTDTPHPEDANSVDTSQRFAHNFLGQTTSGEVTIELVRVLFMHRDALLPDVSFDDSDDFDSHEFVGEIIVRITNNGAAPISWLSSDWYIRINERQIALADFLFTAQFGHNVMDPIFPGSTVESGVWFGIGSVEPDQIQSATLLIRPAYDEDTFRDVTGNFEIQADLSGEHRWEPLPED